MSNELATDTSIVAEVTVDVPAERAFEVFTWGIADYWLDRMTLAGNIGIANETTKPILELSTDGRLYERTQLESDYGPYGVEFEWARVVAFQRPQFIHISWRVNGDHTFNFDPERAAQVHITFVPTNENQTRVKVDARDFDKLGDNWEAAHYVQSSEEFGWPAQLESFKKNVEAAS